MTRYGVPLSAAVSSVLPLRASVSAIAGAALPASPSGSVSAAAKRPSAEPVAVPPSPEEPPQPASSAAQQRDERDRAGHVETADSSHRPRQVKPTITTSIQYCERTASRASR